VARTFCLLIGLSSLLFGSEQFLFSYKSVTVNGVIISEEKNLVPSMVNSAEKFSRELCTLELQNDFKTSNVLFLQKHFDDLLPCFYPLSSHMLSWNTQNNFKHDDRVELVIEPVRFTVVFKDEFATINTFR